MPINTAELLRAAEVVVESKELKVSLKGSAIGAGTAALTTFFGGLFGGPIGLLFGAAGGGLISYKMTKDTFKPVATVLKEDLSIEQKEILAIHLARAIEDFDITDVITLIHAISSHEGLALVMITTVKRFLEKECNLTIC